MPAATRAQGAGREVGEVVGVEGAPEAVVRLVAEAPAHLATEAAWVLAYITGGWVGGRAVGWLDWLGWLSVCVQGQRGVQLALQVPHASASAPIHACCPPAPCLLQPPTRRT